MINKDKLVLFLGIFVVIIAVGGAFITAPKISKVGEIEKEKIVLTGNMTDEGTLAERGETKINKSMEENILEIIFTLKWSDEAPRARYTNQPDTFLLIVLSPMGENKSDKKSNEVGGEGKIIINFTGKYNGEWNVTVRLEECGDQTPRVNIFGLRTIEDTGNNWKLDINYKYYEVKNE